MADQERNVTVALATISGESLATFHVERGRKVSGIKCKVEEDDVLDDLPELSLIFVLLPFDKVQALGSAVMRGHEAAVRSLLRRVAHDDEGRSVLLQGDALGRTGLHQAALRGHSSVCEVLLEAT